ncbi:hypothetical protein [Amycolatopsis sp. CA-230715]|uniref:hypothetical protein n=1 Tax=Amycolatopsis sp. CA-230715 TaxID=2745196 RepID=UPI001C01BEFD|nr:hypothetical protein [Amycolatopsis sp. CA-230715]QWF84107.1 hypothetical protein HUW46_07551 [Amycolatopsis sp. CA-230715]
MRTVREKSSATKDFAGEARENLATNLDLAKARLSAAEQQALTTLCRLGPGRFDLPAAAAAPGRPC